MESEFLKKSNMNTLKMMYEASYDPRFLTDGVMFFSIPSDVKILGYLKNKNAYCNKTIPCCGCAEMDICRGKVKNN